MTGDKLRAGDAERIGRIWRRVEDASLMTDALVLAERLGRLPSRALVQTRQAVDAALPMDFAAALGQEADLQRELGRGADFAEGVAAFLAKRPAVFSDR